MLLFVSSVMPNHKSMLAVQIKVKLCRLKCSALTFKSSLRGCTVHIQVIHMWSHF